ncbi:MAG: hypothetical protein ACRCYV_09755 [Aeromonas sp.]
MIFNKPSFVKGAILLANTLRLGKDETACLYCSDLLKKLIPLLAFLSDELRTQVVIVSKEMLACQERHDWVGMYDYLEFELTEIIEKIDKELNHSK